MTPYKKDLEKLKKADPRTDDELDQVLGLSPSSPESYYANLVFDWLTSRKTPEDLGKRLRICVEENAKLKEEIRLAGGWLQPDGSYKWAYYAGGKSGDFVLLPVDEWIARRKRMALGLRQISEALAELPSDV